MAKEFAEDWYPELRGKSRAGQLKVGKSFKEAAAKFEGEFEIITQRERSPIYVNGHKQRLKNHLVPFFGDYVVTEITPGLMQDYRIHRMKNAGAASRRRAAPFTRRSSACVRFSKRRTATGGCRISPTSPRPTIPRARSRTALGSRRPEYKTLYEATRERAKNPKKERWRTACENLHDFVLFMVNTGLRPDEALRLEFRDVAIVTDDATGERILEIEVRGRRGVGCCKSMPGAVLPFQRVLKRSKGQPTDRVFPKLQRELFNTLLGELNLKKDREGQHRTFYSLRHTYICMRLMEGADIYQVAKNCRTSVEMIENFYASHIKNTLDAAAINVRRPKKTDRKNAGKD